MYFYLESIAVSAPQGKGSPALFMIGYNGFKFQFNMGTGLEITKSCKLGEKERLDSFFPVLRRLGERFHP